MDAANPHRPLRVLLIGERGSGKSTCCLACSAQLRTRGIRPGGVICPKIAGHDGAITGIDVLDVLYDPPVRQPLARKDRRLGGPSTGSYHFSRAGLAFGRDALDRASRLADVVFADELGPLEMNGEGFENILVLARRPSTPPMVIVVRTELALEAQKRLAPLEPTLVTMNASEREETSARLVTLLTGCRGDP